MELDRYGAVLRRGAWLIVVIVALTAVVSAVYPILHPSGWKATTQLLVNPLSGASSPTPDSASPAYYYQPYYEELTSEYILDDYSSVIGGNTFSQDVIALLKQSPQPGVRQAAQGMDANTLTKQFTVHRVHRLIKVDVAASSQDLALAIANAADQLIVRDGPEYFASIDTATPKPAASARPVATVTIADQPHISAKPGLTTDALFWLLRTLAGLAAALAIVLVMHYFDDRLYDAIDVHSALGLPVLGVVRAPRAVESGLARQRAGVAPVLSPVGGGLTRDGRQ